MIDFDGLVLAATQAAFGDPLVWLPQNGPQVAGSGIFNEWATVVRWEDNVEVRENHPIVCVRESQLGARPAQGDGVQLRGRLYIVTDVAPDGVGDVRCVLRYATEAEAYDAWST